jgi:hypothetical protein
MIMAFLEGHPTALGNDFLTNTRRPEEEVVFDDADEHDNDHDRDNKSSHNIHVRTPPSMAKTVVSPYTSTPIKTKKRSCNNHVNNASKKIDQDNNVDDDNDNEETQGRKLDFTAAVDGLQNKKGTRETKLLRKLQAMMRCWFGNGLAAPLVLFLLSVFAVAVYRNPDLSRHVLEYVHALSHPFSNKTHMELAQQLALRHSSHLQTQMELLQDLAQQDRNNAQAKLNATKETLTTFMVTANDSEQVTVVLRQELQQAVTAKEKADAPWQEKSKHISDLLEKYNTERDKRKNLELEKEHPRTQTRACRQDLVVLKEASLHCSTSRSATISHRKQLSREGEPLLLMPNPFRMMTTSIGHIVKTASVNLGDISSHSLRHVSFVTEGILKGAQARTRIAGTQLRNTIEHISTSSKNSFVGAKVAVLSSTSALLAIVEEQLDKSALARIGKMDRGRDSLTMIASLVENQAKNVSREVFNKTNELRKAGTAHIKVVGCHCAQATSVALSKAGQVSRAAEEYVTRQAGAVAGKSKILVTKVAILGERIATTIDHHGLMALNHSSNSMKGSLRTSEVATSKISRNVSEVLFKSGKHLKASWDNSRVRTSRLIRSAAAALHVSVQEGVSFGRIFNQEFGRIAIKNLQVARSKSKDLVRHVETFIGKTIETTVDLGKNVREHVGPSRIVFSKSKKLAQNFGLGVGKRVIIGGEKSLEAQRKMQKGVETLWIHGVSKAPEICQAIAQFWEKLRENASQIGDKLAKDAATATRKFISLILRHGKPMRQKVDDDSTTAIVETTKESVLP